MVIQIQNLLGSWVKNFNLYDREFQSIYTINKAEICLSVCLPVGLSLCVSLFVLFLFIDAKTIGL